MSLIQAFSFFASHFFVFLSHSCSAPSPSNGRGHSRSTSSSTPRRASTRPLRPQTSASQKRLQLQPSKQQHSARRSYDSAGDGGGFDDPLPRPQTGHPSQLRNAWGQQQQQQQQQQQADDDFGQPSTAFLQYSQQLQTH